jgi:hypothetical protein
MRPRRLLPVMIATLVLTALSPALVPAQEATPTSLLPGDRLDLAAMALTQAEMPPGYRQRDFWHEGYTPGDQIATIQLGGTLPTDEVVATGVQWFYSSTFATVDGVDQIYVYLMEFPSPSAVEAGFALFEDERRYIDPAEDVEGLPGPAAGEEPKEMTDLSEAFGITILAFRDPDNVQLELSAPSG